MLTRLTRGHLFSYLLFLLVPGISLKRWLAVGILGLVLIVLGIIFSLKISTGPTFIFFLETASLRNEPQFLRSSVFIGIGIITTVAAGIGLFKSFRQVRQHSGRWTILDSIYLERVLGSGPNVTVIGGGSGLPVLLRGLKRYTSNITAVVTVADDGGSSGRLRTELGILPPGDIRNCLVALSDSEDVMQQLMDYRFESDGQLDGHSFGNLLIAALAGIDGDFYRGVQTAGKLLAIRGTVIPSTTTHVTLTGNTTTGDTLIGESLVGGSSSRFSSLTLIPENPPGHPEAVRAISDADMIVLGPGSLFTSILPNLLIRDVADAIARSTAFKIYVCNVAEEPNQTEGYSIKDHVDVIKHYSGPTSVDAIIANNNLPNRPTPAGLDFIRTQNDWGDPTLLVEANVLDEVSTARHDSVKLAHAIVQAYRKYRGRRRRMPLVRLNLDRDRTKKGNTLNPRDQIQS